LDGKQLYQKAVADMPIFADHGKIIATSSVWNGTTSLVQFGIIWSKTALAVLKQPLKLLHSK